MYAADVFQECYIANVDKNCNHLCSLTSLFTEVTAEYTFPACFHKNFSSYSLAFTTAISRDSSSRLSKDYLFRGSTDVELVLFEEVFFKYCRS